MKVSYVSCRGSQCWHRPGIGAASLRAHVNTCIYFALRPISLAQAHNLKGGHLMSVNENRVLPLGAPTKNCIITVG